jgi:hypothetical protein
MDLGSSLLLQGTGVQTVGVIKSMAGVFDVFIVFHVKRAFKDGQERGI